MRQCPVKQLDFNLTNTDRSTKGGAGDHTLTTNASLFNRNDISVTQFNQRQSVMTFSKDTIGESPGPAKTPSLVRTSVSPNESYSKLMAKKRNYKKRNI